MQYLVNTFEITPATCEALLPSQVDEQYSEAKAYGFQKQGTKKFVSSHQAPPGHN
jgi:hypothetical protein